MNVDNGIILTVFTPAYDRAYSLPRTYASMRAQSNKNFIWLIVDDGSSDGTRELVEGWRREDNGFEIRYIYKENGGMHTAHNTAYANIDTELNVCIDSDDALGEDAVDIICGAWKAARGRGWAGLVGLDADFDGKIIGRGFPDGLEETTLGGYYERGGRGDKKIVLRTDVVREFPPYPVFPGERFVPLGTLYNAIDEKYKLGIVNRVLCNVEYMADGSTKNMVRQYWKNPNGFRYSRIAALKNRPPLKRKLIVCVHYVAESCLAGKSILRDSPAKLTTFFCMLPGLALAARIRRVNRQKQ